MGGVAEKTQNPRIKIDSPKNKQGEDLSDHYPIVVKIAGLKIVSYNLQFMFGIASEAKGKKFFDDLRPPVRDFTDYFLKENADVYCTQELFDNTANELLLAQMLKARYQASQRLNSTFSVPFFNGGVRTFVKQQIAEQGLTHHEYIYENKLDYFHKADAFVNKGLIHTCLKNKEGTTTHIINTHLQSFYTGREHYAEITLVQCVELKKYLENQKIQGIIAATDKVILCGDFNIPKPNQGEKAHFLFEKMTRILGPYFTFLEYDPHTSTQKYTMSLENSNNTNLEQNHDNNANLDMGILYEPFKANASLVDSELSDIYADIQLAISCYVKQNATLFTHWLLPKNKMTALNHFNAQVHMLMVRADELKLSNKNPLDDPNWFSQAIKLLSGPGQIHINADGPEDIPKTTSNSDPHTQTDSVAENEQLGNINEYKQQFDKLLHHLKQIHAQLHKKYLGSPNYYKKAFKTSLKLHHTLLNAGDQFFKLPTRRTLKQLQKLCEKELNHTLKEFKKITSVWSRVQAIIRDLLILIAAITVLPRVIIEKNVQRDFKLNFFNSKPSTIIADIQDCGDKLEAAL